MENDRRRYAKELGRTYRSRCVAGLDGIRIWRGVEFSGSGEVREWNGSFV